jgi:hypothetical protein
MTQNTIILRRCEDNWTAETFGTDRANLIRLFGTADLPTSYAESACAVIVQQEIQQLNPSYKVMIEEQRP